MRKLTFLLVTLIAGAFALQSSAENMTEAQAEQAKRDACAPMFRSAAIYDQLPSGYQSLGENSKIYYAIDSHYSVITGTHETINILGEIDGQYYSSTYNDAGYLMAMQVNGGTAGYIDCVNGSTMSGVAASVDIQPQGEVAARITISLTNNNNAAATVSVGMYGDVWIGTNDYAPIYRLNNAEGETYGLRMKQHTGEDSPLFCALFGEGVTGVTPVDDFWFGHFTYNYSAKAIVGNYDSSSVNYMVEGGSYDSAIGFCWKNRTIEAGETVDFSFLVSVGDVDFEEPIIPDDPEPGEDRFTYEVEAYNITAWNDLSVAHPAHIWGYYEHPYGQEGYIEYSVDGGEWIRIETPLTSGEDYDLSFDMMFNQDVTDIHTLDLRFTLGLGSYSDLDGLKWEDVRSMSLTVNPATQVYDGTPKIFVVTVGGVIDYTLGEDGEYTNPGTYSQSIWGVYEMETIGVNTVEFTVTKGQAEIDVVVPDDVEYDGLAHGATVTVVPGDAQPVVTYINAATGEILTEAPVECGVYIVVVSVPDTEYYTGIPETSYGQFSIYEGATGVEELMMGTEDNAAWYTIDGRRVAAPTERGIYIHNGKKYIVK